MPAPSRQKRLIINADDFGFSPGVTEGIIRAHTRGIVTSTTITPNVPAAEAAAGRLVEAADLGVGVHLNVSQGRPLSTEGKPLAGSDGVMRRSGPGVILACLRRPALLDAVEAEFDAQIRWAIDHGIGATHLDTHRHVHAYGPIFARVVKLARRYHIPFVRRHREKLPGRGWPAAPIKQRIVSRVLNVCAAGAAKTAPNELVTVGTWGVAHTGLIDREFLIRAAAAVPAGVTEIMTHPGLGDEVAAVKTRLVATRRSELEALCDPSVAEAFEVHGIQLIHYGQI